MIRRNIQKVILGISGGVDSTIAGFILKKEGFDVHALFMKNWDLADETGYCSSDQDLKDAVKSCSLLQIPIDEVNFSKDYWNYVFMDTIDQYKKGETPNPDILCNKHIKFDKFVKYSVDRFGADVVATGHYAQTSFGRFHEYNNKESGVRLLQAVDKFKDQTFFLSQIKQTALQKAMFPIGNLTKPQVKKIAYENNFNHVLKKKESTGICFIGRRHFSDFISEYVPDECGSFIDVDTGSIIGSHRGIHHWTLGQRCRIGGTPERSYIAKKNPHNQEIYVALGVEHPIMWSQHITTSQFHWIHSVPDVLKRRAVMKCDFRFQHTKPLTPCQALMKEDGALMIILENPLFAVTPGQFAVLYNGDECLGSAEIKNTSPSLFSLRRPSNDLIAFSSQ